MAHVSRGADRAGRAGELRRAEPNRCHPIVADLADDDAIAKIEAVLSRHGEALDAAINNAGIAGRAARLAEVGTPELRALLEVHCFGALRVCRAAMPWLRRAPRPLIVNISSRLGPLAPWEGDGGLRFIDAVSISGAVPPAERVRFYRLATPPDDVGPSTTPR